MTGVDEKDVVLTAALDRQEKRVQQSPNFLAVLRGPNHIFEFANDAYLRLIGNRNCVGQSVAEAIPEAVPQGFVRILDHVYQTGRTYYGRDQHFELRDRNTGSVQELIVTFQYKAVRDLNGTITGIYAEGVDSRERAQDEAALAYIRQESYRRLTELEAVYENAPVGLALLGAERFEYQRLNRVQAEIIGLPPEQVVGMTAREVSPAAASQVEALLQRAASGETVRNAEITAELPQRPGDQRSFLVSYAPVRYRSEKVDAIICTGVETTELRRAEHIAQQNEKLAAVGRLAASVAHEINNPLEAVTNLLYLAKQADGMEQVQEYLEIADMELRRVSAITTQTLRFHKQSAEPRSVECQDLLGSALGIYQGRLTSAKIRVERRKRTRQSILCFDGEVRQVLNNLIGNSTDALTTKGGSLFLRSRAGTDWRSGQKGVWLTVADTGTGMSAETRRRAFDPFFTTKGIGGTGLGLWISREIMARHNGRLILRSSQDQAHSGTVAAIFLPSDAVSRPAPDGVFQGL